MENQQGQGQGSGHSQRNSPTAASIPLRVLSTKVLSLISSLGYIHKQRKEDGSKLSSILAEGSLNPDEAQGREAAHTFTGKILTEGDCYTPSETAGSSGHERSPLEPPTFTDGESAGQRVEKRPQPTEQPHSGLYPCGGEPQPCKRAEKIGKIQKSYENIWKNRNKILSLQPKI